MSSSSKREAQRGQDSQEDLSFTITETPRAGDNRPAESDDGTAKDHMQRTTELVDGYGTLLVELSKLQGSTYVPEDKLQELNAKLCEMRDTIRAAVASYLQQSEEESEAAVTPTTNFTAIAELSLAVLAEQQRKLSMMEHLAHGMYYLLQHGVGDEAAGQCRNLLLGGVGSAGGNGAQILLDAVKDAKAYWEEDKPECKLANKLLELSSEKTVDYGAWLGTEPADVAHSTLKDLAGKLATNHSRACSALGNGMMVHLPQSEVQGVREELARFQDRLEELSQRHNGLISRVNKGLTGSFTSGNVFSAERQSVLQRGTNNREPKPPQASSSPESSERKRCRQHDAVEDRHRRTDSRGRK